MILTLSWLKNHLNTKASINEIIEKLTNIGLEVEGIKEGTGNLSEFKIAKILNRYDMVVIQEVRDLSGNSIDTLYDYVNDDSSNTRNYSKVVSNRLGSTSSKEQYLYLYNTDKLELKNC